MLTERKVAGAPTPTTSMLTGPSHQESRPLVDKDTTRQRNCQIGNKCSTSLTARVLDLADWLLSQERKARQRALTADDDQQAQALLEQAQQWAEGREVLLRALTGEVGR